MTAMPPRPPLWTARDAIAASGARAVGAAGWEAAGVSIDSRTLRPGDLFVAIRGESMDGHAFVGRAFAAGAAAALVAASQAEALDATGPLLIADDTLAALVGLGRAARARATARIVAVTGSVGKTSTKDALRHVLSAQAPTHGADASHNNHIGVPLTLARLPPSTRYAVCEIGTNHPGEIEPLARMAAAHVGVVTTIAGVHLEHFGTEAAIAEEKARIFAGMAGGTAVLPRDNPHFGTLAARARAEGVARVVGFGRHADAEFRLLDCALDAAGSDVRSLVVGRELRYRVGAPGAHWAMNAQAVLAAVAALGADPVAAAAALESVSAPAGRGARRRVAFGGGEIELVDESYNASPVAVRAMLAVLATTTPGPGGRRLLVLGDMLELGADAEALHVGLAPDIAAAGVDAVFTAGPNMAALSRALPAGLRAAHAPDSARIAQRVVEALRPGDVVAVKGSLGSRMKVVVDAILALGGTAPRATGRV